MSVSIIVAATPEGIIAKDGKIPWRLPDDLKHFREVTMGHPIIMGRKTWDSIGSKPLPGRTNIVVSRTMTHVVMTKIGAGDGVPSLLVVPSIDEAFMLADHLPGHEEIFVIGGAEVYRDTWERANKVYLTQVETHVSDEGALRFPHRLPTLYQGFHPMVGHMLSGWVPLSRKWHPPDDKHDCAFTIGIYERA